MWRQSWLLTPTCLSFSSIGAIKCIMCLEHCGFPLCYFNGYSGSGLSEDWCELDCCEISSVLQGQPESEKRLSMKLRWGLFVSVDGHRQSVWLMCLFEPTAPSTMMPLEAGGYSITRCLRFVVPGLTPIRLCLLNVWMHEYTFYFFSSYLWGLWPPSVLLWDYDGAVCETWPQATWMRWALGASRPREWILNCGNHFWGTLFT